MMAVCVRLCGCLLLLRSVGGGDEVFEIQDRPGWLRPIAGGSMAARFLWVLRLSHGFGFNCHSRRRVGTFWGMRLCMIWPSRNI
jgi:hypothetical protein